MTQADRMHSMPPTSTPIDPNRRRFLTVAAGASVASVDTLAVAAIPTAALTAAPGTDPVYAAIELYKEASAAHNAALQEVCRLEKIDADRDYDWISEKPCHDEFAAFDEVIAVAATTLPGLSAKIAYLQDIAAHQAWMLNDRPGSAPRLIKSFAESIANISAVQL